MRLIAAAAVACCLAASAEAQTAAAPASDPIGLLIDDPISLLLENPIDVLLGSEYTYQEPLPAPPLASLLAPPRRKEAGLELAALDSDLMAVNTGVPLTSAARRPRSGGLGPAELAARAYDPNYAKGWPSPSAQPAPSDAPVRIVMDGAITLNVDFHAPGQFR